MKSSVCHVWELEPCICGDSLKDCKLGSGMASFLHARKVTKALAWDCV